MPVQLYLAPAASGKTAFALALARKAAAGLSTTPRVVVASLLQVRACRRRLAESGGAMGIKVLTFDQLCTECLSAAGEVYVRLSEPVQYRLIRALVDRMELVYYRPLVRRPGFVQVLQKLIGELKAARVWPDDFRNAVREVGDEPRLRELAQVYQAYQERLQSESWADWAGMLWLAVEALEERFPQVGRNWPLLVVDGFDDFTEVQIALLHVLAGRVGELCITLTGSVGGPERRLAHRRFQRTQDRLQEALGVFPSALPGADSRLEPTLAHLEAQLFQDQSQRRDAEHSLELLEATDRASEVRGALRWLKARLATDGVRPQEAALLVRDITPYGPFLLQTAAEFGLPLRLVGGEPLEANPAIAALLDLLRMMVPLTEGDPQPSLWRRQVLEAWRSPYFDWSLCGEAEDPDRSGMTPEDADALDDVARRGQVVAGLSQWQVALDLAAARPAAAEAQDEERSADGGLSAEAAAALWAKFLRFVEHITPPAGENTLRGFVGWLEGLIGDDPELHERQGVSRLPDPRSLQVVERARRDTTGGAELASAERDVAALQGLKDVLRGLVWAEEAVGHTEPLSYTGFLEELEGALQAASYRLPLDAEREEVVAGDVGQMRGLGFRAVALLGMAEGEFPATLSEDSFLRDADRAALSRHLPRALRPSLESEEAELLYSGVTRACERLLMTRPRLAENGAVWQASPFWEEVQNCLAAPVQRVVGSLARSPVEVASWPEWMEYLAVEKADTALLDWTREEAPERLAAWEGAVKVLQSREAGEGPFHGDLTSLAATLATDYGPQHTWSASRLEAYLNCPFRFFVGSVLKLEPRPEPQEGLDARQLGNIYHHIFERLYESLPVDPPATLAQLLDALPKVASAVLDRAPGEEGFRATAWWEQTRQEIVDHVQRSLEKLHEPKVQGDYHPVGHEYGFFEEKRLVVGEGDDQFRLHGLIDRLDQAPDGRVRIIDYKTAGPSAYTNKALTEGEKIQLPLYALAARDALCLGDPADGFYWHVQHAKRSPFTLRGYAENCGRDPIEVALELARQAIAGVREGDFAPERPYKGCPSYCAAATFCPLYDPGYLP